MLLAFDYIQELDTLIVHKGFIITELASVKLKRYAMLCFHVKDSHDHHIIAFE
jgi:hypothetical protein